MAVATLAPRSASPAPACVHPSGAAAPEAPSGVAAPQAPQALTPLRRPPQALLAWEGLMMVLMSSAGELTWGNTWKRSRWKVACVMMV
jgi:hypothetical protein